MHNVSLEEAQAQLGDLIKHLKPGEEITITLHGVPLARVRKAEDNIWPCKAGIYAKAEFWMSKDFDAPLDDFCEYSN